MLLNPRNSNCALRGGIGGNLEEQTGRNALVIHCFELLAQTGARWALGIFPSGRSMHF